ncbi:hypothetical protein Pla175_00980 [Pirellulimonas nuda]|uniref:Double-GTPase 2 domain-containing protein n=1 Tax=Pirellulimonas nuda TaxID=2528009 RepID=A0A518D5K4_9BACT|nr:hypothetical protein [Pirellulimonas nuda]QDU86748.1 hypothetical protein Pla175_00980 [Pirellulimonas nuda]
MLTNTPLESYLLAQTSTALECVICNAENCASAERCRRCHAPLSLTRQSASLRRRPHLIAVLGGPGAGKTVYLGMLLDMLTRGVGGLRAHARGPQSITLQQSTTTALASGWFPDRTPNVPDQWHWVHCRVECGRRRRTMELMLADVAGEAWTQVDVDSTQQIAVPAILSRADGVLLLADAERLHGGEPDESYGMLKALSLLTELRREPGRRGRRPDRRPCAVVFTKADACGRALDDPEGFAESHAATLLGDCRSRLPNTKVFATSVVGASTRRVAAGNRRATPLRVEPQGVVEPLGWLLNQVE